MNEKCSYDRRRGVLLLDDYAFNLPPKKAYKGKDAFLNEENELEVNHLAFLLVKASPGLYHYFFEKHPSFTTKREVQIYILQNVCQYYSTPEAPYESLMDSAVRNLADALVFYSGPESIN